MMGEFPFFLNKVGNKIQLIEENVKFRAEKDSAIFRAINKNITESIFSTANIDAISDKDSSILVNASNLFILDSIDGENIKIDQIRKLLLFLNKSTYYKSVKIVLLDNAEYLNINSSNALLKAIEEPSKDTYFFIINNDSQKIMNTIKSRCIDFVIYFNFLD